MSTQITSSGSKSLGSILQGSTIPYYVPTLQIAISFWLFTHFNGNPTPFFVFNILLPFLGKLLPSQDLPILNAKHINQGKWHLVPMFVNMLAVWASVLYCAINYPCSEYTWGQTLQMVAGFMNMTAGSITVAHELFHRPQKYMICFTYPYMAIFLFSVYPIEHLFMHHKHVGPKHDPITAPKGQSFYAYMANAYVKAHQFVFRRNKVTFLGCMLAQAAYFGGLFLLAFKQSGSIDHALSVVGFFSGVGFAGYILFEAVEYIEHYGLVFDANLDPNFIRESSAWNCKMNLVHNLMLFRVQRHSDHHLNAYKPYNALQLRPKMPMLPCSLLEAAYMGIVPPLWFYIMHPYVDEALGQEKVNSSHRFITDVARNSVSIVFAALSSYMLYNM